MVLTILTDLRVDTSTIQLLNPAKSSCRIAVPSYSPKYLKPALFIFTTYSLNVPSMGMPLNVKYLELPLTNDTTLIKINAKNRIAFSYSLYLMIYTV